MRAYLVDILAVGFFMLEWAVYAFTLEHTAYGRDSLSAPHACLPRGLGPAHTRP